MFIKKESNHVCAPLTRARIQAATPKGVVAPWTSRAGSCGAGIIHIGTHASVVGVVCDGVIALLASEGALNSARHSTTPDELTISTCLFAPINLADIIDTPSADIDLTGITVGAFSADSSKATPARRLVLTNCTARISTVCHLTRCRGFSVGDKVLVSHCRALHTCAIDHWVVVAG